MGESVETHFAAHLSRFDDMCDCELYKKTMLDSNSTLIIDVQVIKLGKMLAKHGLHE